MLRPKWYGTYWLALRNLNVLAKSDQAWELLARVFYTKWTHLSTVRDLGTEPKN